ncbi:herpud1-A-prov protein [Loa loa]|nr:herpud1-A-prov protein [Loa loa]EFO25037.1 herpud1-A-prov protein [Loa loa]
MTELNDENVRLLIRCALQSFDDLSINCLSSWTVLQLKEKLAVDCPSKPEAKKQRLIYAGHCLHDDHTLKSVFELRPIDDGNVHVIHLVCPPKDFNTHVGASVLRRRNANHTQASSISLRSAAQVQNHNVNGGFPFYTYPLWGNAAVQGSFATPQSMLVSSSAHFQNAYQAYMISYNNYVYQMMTALENSSSDIHFPSQFLLNSQQTVLQSPQQANQRERAGPNLAAAPAAGGIVQEAVAGDVDGQQRDFLDAIYKAIRMCLLVMLVYVYSSAERFFGVLIFILLVWFIQARRDRNNRERADREFAAAIDNVRQPQETDVGHDHGTDGSAIEAVTTGIDEDEPREPTAWVVFWSTCYTFITSFFSSLIPDNPLPVNVN